MRPHHDDDNINDYNDDDDDEEDGNINDDNDNNDEDNNDQSKGKWRPSVMTNQRHASPQCVSCFIALFGFETFDCYDEDSKKKLK